MENMSEEGGRKLRRNCEGYRKKADDAMLGGDPEQEIVYCRLLADMQTLLEAQFIEGGDDEIFLNFLKATELTWVETVYWAHRCLKRVLEREGMKEMVGNPFCQKLRDSIVLASTSQSRLLLFEEAMHTADLFLEVKSAEISIEEFQVHMTRGNARFQLGLPASVQDFCAAVDLAQQLKLTDFEAEALFAKGLALYFVHPLNYRQDVVKCFTKSLDILQAKNNTTRHDRVSACFKQISENYETNFAPKCQSETPEAEIERLEKAEEEASNARDGFTLVELAYIKKALGYWLFHQKMFLKAEEKLRQAVNLLIKTTKKYSMYQVLAGQNFASACRQLQSCLVEQGKPLEALMWAERGRARALRVRVETAGECDNFEEDDIFAQEKIQTALNCFSRSVVAVEYSFVNTSLLIWVLKQGSLPNLYQVPLDTMDFPPIEGREEEKVPFTIMKLVDELLRRISTSNWSNQVTAPYLIFFHNLLMEPIKEELRGCDTIVIIPVQALNSLPWAALLDPHQEDARRYLVQRHAVVCAPSLYLLGVCSQHLAEKTKTECSHDDEVMLVSNPWPLSLPNQPSLRSSEKEAADIRKLVKHYTGLVPKEYKKGGASRATIVENLPKAKWVHMACHNILNSAYPAGALMLSPKTIDVSWKQPPDQLAIQLESGSVLHCRSDIGSIVGQTMDDLSSQVEMDRGVLSARQLTHIPLQAYGVVLSACSTGDGVLISEEGILGLAHALLVAGTPAVLLSLWKVLDGQTHELMTHIYKNLIEGDPRTRVPYNLAFAVREAMKSMIDKPGMEVRHWAAFQIIGTPDVMFPVAKKHDCKDLGWSQKNIAIAPLFIVLVAIFLAILFASSYNQLNSALH